MFSPLYSCEALLNAAALPEDKRNGTERFVYSHSGCPIHALLPATLDAS
jgi:hypothetical protein